MNSLSPVFKREFLSYFRSPIGYVFLVFFSVLSVLIAFFFFGFFKNSYASLDAFFLPAPWLLLVLAPAVGMGLWSEEKRSGTLELLFTLPLSPVQTVLGKYLAGWAFLALALVLTLPLLLTCTYLGDPDLGVVASSYLGCVLLAGTYLAICALTSSLTKNQIVSFIVGFFVCFLFTFLGTSVFNSFLSGFLGLPVAVVDAISNFSPYTHVSGFTKGIVDLRDVVFFLSVSAVSLSLNALTLER